MRFNKAVFDCSHSLEPLLAHGQTMSRSFYLEKDIHIVWFLILLCLVFEKKRKHIVLVAFMCSYDAKFGCLVA